MSKVKEETFKVVKTWFVKAKGPKDAEAKTKRAKPAETRITAGNLIVVW